MSWQEISSLFAVYKPLPAVHRQNTSNYQELSAFQYRLSCARTLQRSLCKLLFHTGIPGE